MQDETAPDGVAPPTLSEPVTTEPPVTAEAPPAVPAAPVGTVSIDTDGDGDTDLSGTVAPVTPDAPDATPPADPPPVEKVRRGRGNLEADVKTICDSYAQGDITLEDGEYLTPHRIGKFIVERLHEESAPSTGAVAACLHRWVDYGYIVANERAPFAFLDFTDAARTLGLSALKEKFRAAKKAAATPAPAPEAPVDPAPATTPETPETPVLDDPPPVNLEESGVSAVPDIPDNPV